MQRHTLVLLVILKDITRKLYNSDMDRNTLNRFLGYREKPTISSWAKEQMEKDGIDTSRYKTYADIHQEKVEEKKRKKKLSTIITIAIIIIAILTVVYERITGDSLLNLVQRVQNNNYTSYTTTHIESTETP